MIDLVMSVGSQNKFIFSDFRNFGSVEKFSKSIETVSIGIIIEVEPILSLFCSKDFDL